MLLPTLSVARRAAPARFVDCPRHALRLGSLDFIDAPIRRLTATVAMTAEIARQRRRAVRCNIDRWVPWALAEWAETKGLGSHNGNPSRSVIALTNQQRGCHVFSVPPGRTRGYLHCPS